MLYALLLVVCATSCLAEWVQRGGAGKQDREYWFSKHNNLVFGLHLDEGKLLKKNNYINAIPLLKLRILPPREGALHRINLERVRALSAFN